jgi:hypothetical protein
MTRGASGGQRDSSVSLIRRLSRHDCRMNEAWAVAELETFIDLTRLVHSGGAISGGLRNNGTPGEIAEAAQVVEQILVQVLPKWRTDVPNAGDARWKQHNEAAHRAIVAIKRAAEVAANLGDNAPSLNAGAFHPWAWEAARSLWQSRHYREAVHGASVKINAELQNKVGNRNLSEAALFQLAFSSDPPKPESPRLRPAGDDGGKTALSVRRGIVALAEACYGMIRNPASHDEGELQEQFALEQLATLSVLARALDDATIERAL